MSDKFPCAYRTIETIAEGWQHPATAKTHGELAAIEGQYRITAPLWRGFSPTVRYACAERKWSYHPEWDRTIAVSAKVDIRVWNWIAASDGNHLPEDKEDH